MSQISMFKYFLLFAVLCSVGLCRPSDDDGLIEDRASGPLAVEGYAQDEAGLGGDGDEEAEEEEKPQNAVHAVIPNKAEEISVEEGYSVTLPCEPEHAEPYVIVWRNGTNMIYQEKNALIPDRHRVYLSGYSLQIQNVTIYDSGVYTCAVIESDTSGPKVSHTLHVKEPAKIDVFQPRGPKQIVEKGKSLSFVCHATGYPQPTVFWTRRVKGSNTPENLKGTNYTIPSINREHAGIYECVAKNVDVEQKENVEIFVHYEPEVSIKSDTVNTAEGKVAEMHCTVYAEPPASLVWLKEDKVLHSNGHIQLYQDKNKHHKHVLKIENTKAEDFGTYYCIANNSLGTTRKSITLSGTPLRPIFERASMAADGTSPRLVWTVQSMSPIKSYELQYRRQEADVDTWFILKPKVIPSPDGTYYSVVHDLYGLESGTYEAVLRAENAYGWSYPSPPSIFSGEDNMNNEILQGPLEPNPNNASQLRISFALVLSILVAMVYC